MAGGVNLQCSNPTTCHVCTRSAEELLKASPNLAVVVEPVKSEPVVVESVKTEPVESVKTEPVEPVKAEPEETEYYRKIKAARSTYLSKTFTELKDLILASVEKGGIRFTYDVKGKSAAQHICDLLKAESIEAKWDNTKFNGMYCTYTITMSIPMKLKILQLRNKKMFFVRSLIGTTIKPLLGRFVKGGVQIPATSDSTFQLDNLILKEETIEELIHSAVPKLFVKHASVDSICVDVGRAGITVKWNNINVIASVDGVKRSQSQSTAQDELGSSLMNSSASSSTPLAPSAGILPGLAQRIESITNAVQHTIPLITINVEDMFVVTINNATYNDSDGLKVESIRIGDVDAIHDLQLLSNAITIGRLVLSDEHLNLFQKTMLSTPSTAPSLSLIIKITDCELRLSDKLVVRVDGLQLDLSRRHVLFNKIDVSTSQILDGEITYNTRQPSSSQNFIHSLFDCDKIFMYHESIRPSPVAPVENLALYHASTFELVDSTVTIKCRAVTVTDYAVVDELQHVISTFLTPASASPKQSTFAVEVLIGQTFSFNFGGKQIIGNNSSINIDNVNSTLNWCVRCDSVGLPSLVTGSRVRAVGTSVSKISVDVDNVFVSDVCSVKQWLIDLIPENKPDNADVDVCLRVSKCRIARSEWLLPNSDVLAVGLDVFTIGKSVVITVGSLETTYLRSNAIQVHVGDSNNISIRSALVNVLADPHEVASVIRRFTDNEVEVEGVAANQECRFNLADHQVIRKYSQSSASKSPSTKVGELKISITKAFVQLRHTNCGSGHVDVTVDGLKIKKTSERLIAVADHLVVSNKLTSAVLPPAVIARYFIFTSIGVNRDFIARFAKLHGGTENVTLNVDQSFIDFCVRYADEFKSALASSPKEPTEPTEPAAAVNSFKISAIKARITYKPGVGTEVQSHFLRWVPISNAAVKIKQFECFGMTQSDIGIAYGMHLLSDKKNFVRLASGISLIKAPAEMLKNLTELILIPINREGLNEAESQSLVGRVQGLSTKTLVSVLSVGASGSRIQPTGIKQGAIQAGEVFRRDANTMIAFVTEGGGGTVELLQLPMMMVRPATTLISGVCNQLDPKRIQR